MVRPRRFHAWIATMSLAVVETFLGMPHGQASPEAPHK